MSKNTGGPAFPIPGLQDDAEFNGMTLRDYFAAKVLQGYLSGDCSWRDNDYVPENGLSIMGNNARMAYQIADAMLAERDNG